MEVLDAQDALEVFAQFSVALEITRLLLEATDEQGVAGILAEQSFDVLLQDQLDVLLVHLAEFGVGHVLGGCGGGDDGHGRWSCVRGRVS